MPGETIYDEAEMYDVHVGWRREPGGYVQVGVETHGGRPLVEALTTTLEDARLEAAEFQGVWGTLDRSGCNRLIRALRRARDQAFGADA